MILKQICKFSIFLIDKEVVSSLSVVWRRNTSHTGELTTGFFVKNMWHKVVNCRNNMVSVHEHIVTY